ncbi:E3 ubiquitin-protein ligase TRIM39-like [Ambystoma mexicanum]|uniref:E3 ubiquitin-protein ligase TRIM39-like n=1 Tax=Ambystoma mexicanum TaxID=8296 RepID=UPI0037E7CE37
MYADDILLHLKNPCRSVLAVFEIIEEYGSFLGFEIYRSKLVLFPLDGDADRDMATLEPLMLEVRLENISGLRSPSLLRASVNRASPHCLGLCVMKWACGDKLYSQMEHLKKELKEMQEWGEEESRKSSELEGNIMKQRENILSTFEHLKQFLEKEKQQLLSRLEKEQEEKMKKIQEKLTRLEKQQSTHRGLITELERTCQQQDVDLLKVRGNQKPIELEQQSTHRGLIPEMEQRYQQQDRELQRKQDEAFVNMYKQNSSKVKNSKLPFRTNFAVWDSKSHNPKSTGMKKMAEDQCRPEETFPAEMDWRYVKSCEREVTLDSGTAHPLLIVSADGRSVRRGPRAQDLPDTPQRFTIHWIVLGREGLSSGGHYWEVEVGGSPGWILGVCDESVPRKEGLTLSPARGFWTVELWDGKYWALTSPHTRLTPRAPPGVLGLFLDYEAGRLSVYDAQDRALLFTFPGAPFPRTLRPYFCTWSTEGGLRILPVAGGD